MLRKMFFSHVLIILGLICLLPIAKTQAQSHDELVKEAKNSAAKGFGRLLGEELAYQEFQKLREEDQWIYLNAKRNALRGALLNQYLFSSGPQFDSKNQSNIKQSTLSGYVVTKREGYDRSGNYCREYQSEIQIGLQSYFHQGASCYSTNEIRNETQIDSSGSGRWIETPLHQIRFRQVATPHLPDRNRRGTWLPPLRP